MRPMKDRNQITVGIFGTAIAAVLVLLAINLSNIPFLNPTHSYHANFATSDGLKSGDDVRVLGIPVGQVDDVVVDGDHARVDFSVKDSVMLGSTSSASIEVATVLGNLFMQIESSGSGRLAPGGTIPVTRTSVPYSLVGALQQFASFGNQTNAPNLAKSLKTLATSISGISPADAKATLAGLSDIATTLANKQTQVNQILDAATTITDTLNKNSGSLVQLLIQGDDFLKLIQQRRDVVSALLRDTASLGEQLNVLIERNGAHLSGLLANLKTVSAVLVKEKAQLQSAVQVLGQFSVNIANATGSGPWLDLVAPALLNPDNTIKKCGLHPNSPTRPCGD